MSDSWPPRIPAGWWKGAEDSNSLQGNSDSLQVMQSGYVRQTGPNTYLVQCRYCEGKGIYPHVIDENWHVVEWKDDGYACLNCYGKGVLEIEAEGMLLEHGPCHGSGKLREHNGPKEGQRYVWDKINSDLRSGCADCLGLGLVLLRGKIRILN